MRKILLTLLLIIILSGLLFADNYKILNKTKDYITIEMNFYGQVKTGSDFTMIKADDWEFNGKFKAPELPLKELKIIVPENGYIRIKMIDVTSSTMKLSKPILPVPTPFPGEKTSDFKNIIDKNEYNNFYKKPITIKEKSEFRYYEYIPIELSPIVFDGSLNKIKIFKKILFRIEIFGNKNQSKDFHDKFADISKSLFINYDQAKYWQNSIKKRKSNKLDFSKSDFWYKFSIKNYGLNKISSDALKQLPDFADYKTLRLFKVYKDNKNKYILKQVPIQIFNKELYFKNNFDPDRQKRGATVFWLTFGGDFMQPIKRLHNLSIEGQINQIDNLKKRNFPKKQRGNEQADCLIIYPTVFSGIAGQLSDFHNSELNVKTVLTKQEDIIDEYSGGYADPAAIKDYLQDAYQNWPSPALQYVILLGSGTYDGLLGFDDITLSDWYNLNPKNKMLVNGAGVDDYFVDILTGIKRPQMSISRFPFKSVQQFDTYFERMKNYFTNLPSGWWQNKITILADDENHAGEYEGMGNHSEFNHTDYSQKLQNNLSPLLDIDKVLGINYPLDEFNTKPAATKELIKRLNEGRLIWVYIGHGNYDVMGDESYFIGSDIGKLYNVDHLPLLVAGSCNNGEFDNPDFDCVGERILYGENGGTIASIGASRGSGPKANYYFILMLLGRMVNLNHYDNVGKSLLFTKQNIDSYYNAKLFNLFGDPLLQINPPKKKGDILFKNSKNNYVSKRQTCLLSGNFQSTVNYDKGDLRVYNSPKWATYTNYNYVVQDTVFYSVDYTLDPSTIFKGHVDTSNNDFNGGFIVPDEANAGNNAKILCYAYDEESNDRILSALCPFTISNNVVDTLSNDKPEINIWVDSEKFKPGDTVSSSPTIYAAISDNNGINITGEPGRKILLLIKTNQKEENLIDMTNSFEYDDNSFTSGRLEYPLDNLDEGVYNISIFAYDNFGDWSQKDTYFKVKNSKSIEIYQDLPYPNPMDKNGGKFTFLLSEEGDVSIDLYTITGKKIKHLYKPSCNANYNEINWAGRDEEGDILSNGTYFYLIKAVSLSTGKSTKKTGKFIIEK